MRRLRRIILWLLLLVVLAIGLSLTVPQLVVTSDSGLVVSLVVTLVATVWAAVVTARSGTLAAWAMLVRLMAVKNRVMLRPKNSPAGRTAFHVAADGGGRPVALRRTRMTIHHSTTAPSMRQNASTDPGVSAHLTIVELLEKASTASSIATMPIGANAGSQERRELTVAGAVVQPAGIVRDRQHQPAILAPG